MLRHIGLKRTNEHNFKLAGLLSFTAGFVNAAGFLSFVVLTTNITGHVAIFAEKLVAGDYKSAWIIGAWMLLFLTGAFVSSLIINILGRNQRFAYTIPILIETGILLLVAGDIHWFTLPASNANFMAGSLLFAMGLQNAMVSMISGSVVRTTHLTGMFTDLGIELAGIFYSSKKQTEKPISSSRILLKLVIIIFFFAGCIISAYCYRLMKFSTFYIPAGLLMAGMVFDIFRIKTIKYYRIIKHRVLG
ncbi:MAG: YoaK family protein [Mucilaginibacter sp.]